ncbi:hypothetical protein IQ65_11670 [Leptospira interrogans serovar Lai]|nr:hypothetical protein IQ65_11670 [Leptospira interrogans serovar Lai]
MKMVNESERRLYSNRSFILKKIKIEELKTSFTAFAKSIGIFKIESWVSLSTGLLLKISYNQTPYFYGAISH